MEISVCMPQSPPLDHRHLPSTRQYMPSKALVTKMNRKSRTGSQISMVTKIPMLLLFTIASSSFVGALLEPNYANGRTRITRPAPEAFFGSVWTRNRANAPIEGTSTTALFAANDDKAPKKVGRKEGVYVRPSGAIEKGSGFFVPGLEGPKVRLVIGLVLLGATAVNHLLLGDVGSFGNKPKDLVGGGGLSFSETTAIVYSLLLLFQSAIEYAKEALPEAYGEATKGKSSAKKAVVDSNTEVLEQKWSSESANNESYRSRVQWAAASYLSMTPTNQILLLDAEEGIQYRLGNSDSKASNDSSGVSAALDELSNSKGGRIALPLTHPAVTSLLGTAATSSSDEEDGSKLRTVILQRITDDSCWMVSSDQLLAGYTGGDLKWLGKLAGYVAASE